MKILEQAQLEKTSVFYLYECSHCKQKLVIPAKELKHVPYQPITKEITTYKIGKEGGSIEEKSVVLVSSNPSLDTFRFICCHCGHLNEITTQDYWSHHCNSFGEQTLSFSLSESQYKKLKYFREKQREECEKIDALCMRETFTIIPSTLGNVIKVTDNFTKNSLDLTEGDLAN